MSDSSKILEVIETVKRLRAPDGCPWDRKQTHTSLRPFLIEEAYEVLEVLDRMDTVNHESDSKKLDKELCAELGDLLLQILLHSEIAESNKSFDLNDVAVGLNEKLKRRHPHVFGDSKVDGAEGAYANWEKIKAEEKKDSVDPSVLSGVPKNLPSLQRATRVIEKVSRVGFQWPDMVGPLEKLDEEIQELKDEIQKSSKGSKNIKRIQAELGDLLFCICNVAHHMGISPEDALRGNLKRFEFRFRHVEDGLRSQGKSPKESTLEEMDKLWDDAKKIEKSKV